MGQHRGRGVRPGWDPLWVDPNWEDCENGFMQVPPETELSCDGWVRAAPAETARALSVLSEMHVVRRGSHSKKCIDLACFGLLRAEHSEVTVGSQHFAQKDTALRAF